MLNAVKPTDINRRRFLTQAALGGGAAILTINGLRLDALALTTSAVTSGSTHVGFHLKKHVKRLHIVQGTEYDPSKDATEGGPDTAANANARARSQTMVDNTNDLEGKWNQMGAEGAADVDDLQNGEPICVQFYVVPPPQYAEWGNCTANYEYETNAGGWVTSWADPNVKRPYRARIVFEQTAVKHWFNHIHEDGDNTPCAYAPTNPT